MKIARLPAFLGVLAILITSIGAGQKPRMTAISGVVQDEKGKPAGDVVVEAPYRGRVYTTQTGADGKFTLKVEEGDLRFEQTKLSVQLVAKTRDGAMQAFRPEYGSEKEEKPLVLRPAREIEVVVQDAENRPVAGAQVLVDASFAQVGKMLSEESGKAKVKVPANAKLAWIVATKPGVGLDYVLFWPSKGPHSDPYRLEQDVKGPLTFTLNGMTKMSLRVTDEQERPLAGVMVDPWYFEKPRKGDDVNLSGNPYFRRQTDERGLAEFEVPSDNTKRINFWARLDGYTSFKRWLWDPKSNEKQVEVKLIKQLRIVGRVMDVDRKPAGGAWVSINGANYDSFDGVYQGTFANQDGTFEHLIDPDMYYMFLARKGQGASLPVLKMIHREVTEPVELALEPATLLEVLVTAGPDKKPLEGASVTLSEDDGGSYYKLPKEQQFPGDGNGRRAIYLSAAQHHTSDKNGVAEFYIAPGSYQLRAYIPNNPSQNAVVFNLTDDGKYTLKRYEGRAAKEEKHVVADEKVQINLHYDAVDAAPKMLKGRVVLRDKPEVGVADAVLTGASTDTGYPRGASDRDGRFTVGFGKGQLYLNAVTADGKMRGIKIVAPGENDVLLPIGPTASAHGRILDHEGKVMPGATIEYGVQINHTTGTFSWNFGGNVVCTPEGSFTIEGLVPGFEYMIEVATSLGEDGRGRSWLQAGKVKPTAAERIELGDLKLPAPYRPKGAEDYAAEAFARPEPFEQRLAAALRRARLSTQNVMLILGGAKSKPVQRFFVYRYDFRNSEFWNAMMEHWMMAVDTDKPSEAMGAWADRNNVPLAGPGFVMVILDPDGKVIGQSTSDLLSTDGELDRRLVMEFAKKYAPAKPDGKKLFDEAMARAKAEGKKVLFDESGPYCGPCYQFSEYLEANKELIERDYVCVTMDYRFAGAKEIFERLKAATSTPWIAVLDADGKVLATSDGPDGNVGFEKPKWENMLRATASKLTAAQIATLVEKVKE